MTTLLVASLPLAACSKKKDAPAAPSPLATEAAVKNAPATGAAADPLPNAPPLPADQVTEAKTAEFLVLLPKRPKAEVEESSSGIEVNGVFSQPIKISRLDQFYGTKEAFEEEFKPTDHLEAKEFLGAGRGAYIEALDDGRRLAVATVALDDERMVDCRLDGKVGADEAKAALEYCKAVAVQRAPVATPGALQAFDVKGVKFQLPMNDSWHAEHAGDAQLDVNGIVQTRVEVALADFVIKDKESALEALTPTKIVEGGTVNGGRFAMIDEVSVNEFNVAVADKVDDQRSIVCTGTRLGSLQAAKRVLAFCQGMKLTK